MDSDKLIAELQKDQDYKTLEVLESQFKKYILELADQGDVNSVVSLTHSVGLLLKYKPYGVKCSSILGYSIFILNEREGFSFQRHLDFKTELFHIIDVSRGGYAFIADSIDFEAATSQAPISDFWNGSTEAFDKFKLSVTPGDIVKIERTGIVHTAIGCTLEEYANTSTDMVDRLFDQNSGRATTVGSREEVLKKLNKLTIPFPEKEYALEEGKIISKQLLESKPSKGISIFNIHESKEFTASRISFKVNSKYTLRTENQFVSLITSQGNLQMVAQDNPTVTTLNLGKMESVILPPSTIWEITANSTSDLSVLAIDKTKALKK